MHITLKFFMALLTHIISTSILTFHFEESSGYHLLLAYIITMRRLEVWNRDYFQRERGCDIGRALDPGGRYKTHIPAHIHGRLEYKGLNEDGSNQFWNGFLYDFYHVTRIKLTYFHFSELETTERTKDKYIQLKKLIR